MQKKWKKIIVALLPVSLIGCASTGTTVKRDGDKSAPVSWGIMVVEPGKVVGQGKDFHQWKSNTIVLCKTEDCAKPTPKTRVFNQQQNYMKKMGGFVKTNVNKPVKSKPMIASLSTKGLDIKADEPKELPKPFQPAVPPTSTTEKPEPVKAAVNGVNEGVVSAAAQTVAVKVADKVVKPKLLHTVHFDWAKSNINSDETDIITRLVTTHSEAMLTVTGYTDNTTVEDASIENRTLALERAEAVKALLVKQGFPVQRIEIKGMEMCCYVSENISEEGRKKNRRAEITAIIINEEKENANVIQTSKNDL